MMDSHENTPILEETKTPVLEEATSSDVTAAEESTTVDAAKATEEKTLQTKAEVIEYLKELAKDPVTIGRAELDRTKQVFYKLHNAEQEALRKEFVENGGAAENYVPQPDPLETEYKELMANIKEQRAERYAAIEQERAENLQKKESIINEIQGLTTSPEETGRHFDRFKELQQQWKETGNVAADKAAEVWKNYQHVVEQYYDLLKLNHEMREYDFKKNLEQKTALCEKAEKLAEREDLPAAFRELQKLHEEYREIGPVAKELREEIWNRFKAATTIINKKHQQYYDNIKAQEQANLEEKTALCETMEGLNAQKPESMQGWNDTTKTVIQLQEQWKSIGFAPQKANTKIFERFRTACDEFFTAKAAYFREARDKYAENLARKEALCARAEELRESTDWKNTAEEIQKLKEEWKSVGPVARKLSDAIWHRFIGACDAFFENRRKVNNGQHSEERENLKKKRAVIEQLQQLATELPEEAANKLHELQNEWNEIGHVPFKEKDTVYENYRAAVNALRKALNLGGDKRKGNKHNSKAEEENTPGRERARLQKAYEKLAAEIKTYENNLNFLTTSSKKGNSLVDQMLKKVEKEKEELAALAKKIAELDE